MATASYTPLEAPLFPTPEDTVFTEIQWQSLLSLCDVVIPALTSEPSPKQSMQKPISVADFDSTLSTLTKKIHASDAAQLARRYLEENVSSNPAFKEGMRRAFSLYVPQESKNGLSLILSALK